MGSPWKGKARKSKSRQEDQAKNPSRALWEGTLSEPSPQRRFNNASPHPLLWPFGILQSCFLLSAWMCACANLWCDDSFPVFLSLCFLEVFLGYIHNLWCDSPFPALPCLLFPVLFLCFLGDFIVLTTWIAYLMVSIAMVILQHCWHSEQGWIRSSAPKPWITCSFCHL